jgi:tRNA (cytidine/uridine-2'-O-)-methyltransferase
LQNNKLTVCVHMRLALYQPDIAGNVGTILRLTACLGVPCDIIHPCGFAFSERALKRAGMDYAALADMREHDDWAAFEAMANNTSSRIVLMSSKASTPLPEAKFQAGDILLMGSESAGAPPVIHERADVRIHIPMREGFRSLNVAVAAGIALAEGLRQTGQFPAGATR